ncbi:MAG: hypothetical protein DWQ05_21770 [Calditrichaeota bacterium]|nr:MAG: hypothetical protein DWQ05_21770 [Calditrichota bacterium]
MFPSVNPVLILPFQWPEKSKNGFAHTFKKIRNNGRVFASDDETYLLAPIFHFQVHVPDAPFCGVISRGKI